MRTKEETSASTLTPQLRGVLVWKCPRCGRRFDVRSTAVWNMREKRAHCVDCGYERLYGRERRKR